MNLSVKMLPILIILVVFCAENFVLGDCGGSSRDQSIFSDKVTCLYKVDGNKCPHGLLRMDPDEDGKRACVGRLGGPDSDKVCCLLALPVDVKIKESPCTADSTDESTEGTTDGDRRRKHKRLIHKH